jgi:hypothetical protein
MIVSEEDPVALKKLFKGVDLNHKKQIILDNISKRTVGKNNDTSTSQ